MSWTNVLVVNEVIFVANADDYLNVSFVTLFCNITVQMI